MENNNYNFYNNENSGNLNNLDELPLDNHQQENNSLGARFVRFINNSMNEIRESFNNFRIRNRIRRRNRRNRIRNWFNRIGNTSQQENIETTAMGVESASDEMVRGVSNETSSDRNMVCMARDAGHSSNEVIRQITLNFEEQNQENTGNLEYQNLDQNEIIDNIFRLDDNLQEENREELINNVNRLRIILARNNPQQEIRNVTITRRSRSGNRENLGQEIIINNDVPEASQIENSASLLSDLINGNNISNVLSEVINMRENGELNTRNTTLEHIIISRNLENR